MTVSRWGDIVCPVGYCVCCPVITTKAQYWGQISWRALFQKKPPTIGVSHPLTGLIESWQK